ncbi:H/ACA ribonucleoprotein complex subunit 4 [Platanthera guangdongensis]|uniref:H/ACA ribonucleoprotein complex subunit 4 n=1 Tax=Platanthera guangdongensis TaxID=2320717 RepID=A0ABR2MCH7_9ASPA
MRSPRTHPLYRARTARPAALQPFRPSARQTPLGVAAKPLAAAAPAKRRGRTPSGLPRAPLTVAVPASPRPVSRSPLPDLDNSTWPNLLANFDRLNVPTGQHDHSPLNRPLQIYLRCGVINIDKPSHLSSHQVAKKIKDIMGAKKTGHDDILRRKVTGNLVVFMNNSTRLIKYLQEASMEFICIALLHSAVPDTWDVVRVIKNLTGPVLQCPPVKGRLLRNPTIHDSKLLGYDPQKLLVCFWISCEVGTNVEKHCAHLGLLLGVGAHMHELRRVRPGFLGEHGNMFTIQNVEHAMKSYKVSKDERYLRKFVMPVEVLLTRFKRLVVRDSVVFVLCHGGKLMLHELLHFENFIEKGEEVVMITTKEEDIGIEFAKMSSAVMSTSTDNTVAKLKRVLMDTNLYPRQIQHS